MNAAKSSIHAAFRCHKVYSLVEIKSSAIR
jgi:hypothetical protein